MLNFLQESLKDLETAGALRELSTGRPTLIDVASNDYLGYARQPVSRATLLACEAAETGAGASRLIFGTTDHHLALEAELADWVQLESALLFSSGYAANVGVLQALASRGDLVVSDALNHASIIDGCRLSRADVAVAGHCSVDAVARALKQSSHPRKWVVTESYFSMDGDQPDLAGLREVCNTHSAGLIVDEAHALGVFGPGGAGLCVAAGIRPDVLVGTLGKAVGLQGAFVAGARLLNQWLWNRARSLVFSTGTSPVLSVIALELVRQARSDDAGRARLLATAARLRRRLADAGVVLPPTSLGPIVPIVLGDNARALSCASRLQAAGFRACAIRPPTVPAGSARLRITVSSALDEASTERLAACLIEAITA